MTIEEPTPAFVHERLALAGKGEPGLSVDQQGAFTHRIVYRDPSGDPVASLEFTPGGTQVHTFAADKSKGLLYGKAVKATADKAAEMGLQPPKTMSLQA